MIASQRVAVVVLARSGSSRLPGKMLLPFGTGSVLSSSIERSAAIRYADDVVLATTTAPGDDVLADAAERIGVRVVRGSEDDVVARMLQAVQALDPQPDIVVRACADNPLVMPAVVEEAIEDLVDSCCDVITPAEVGTYPFGFGLVVMRRECLERIDREATEPAYREHVENFCLERPEQFHLRYQLAPPDLAFPELCTTLDYQVDYTRLGALERALRGVTLRDQPQALIEHLRCARTWIEGRDSGAPEGHDLVLLAHPLRGLTAPRGVVVVDTFEVAGARVYGLRYSDSCPQSFPRGPLYLDTNADAERETPLEFLTREADLALPHLLAAPARPIDLQEVATPPREKRVCAEQRRGYASAAEQAFPTQVVLELAGQAQGEELLDGLLQELERRSSVQLVLSDPDGTSPAQLAQAIRSLGAERVVEGEPWEDALRAPFCQLRVSCDGSLRVAGTDAQGHLSGSSLAAFWRSIPARTARATVLNREAAP